MHGCFDEKVASPEAWGPMPQWNALRIPLCVLPPFSILFFLPSLTTGIPIFNGQEKIGTPLVVLEVRAGSIPTPGIRKSILFFFHSIHSIQRIDSLL